jgi:CoA:oxalate CoA-transferase
VLDMSLPEGRQACLDLAREADVVVESFRPGVVDRLGVGYDDVVTINPNVIYASVSGYGQTGPLALERGHDVEYLARVGALDLAPRRPDGTPIWDSAFVVGDYASGMYAVVGILTALARPELRPVHIDVGVAPSALAWAFPKMVAALTENRTGIGDSDHEAAGIGIFRTKDGRFVTISSVENHVFEKLCTAIGRPDFLDRPEMATYQSRREHAKEINDAIRGSADQMDQSEFFSLLHENGVAAAPVRTVGEVFDDAEVGFWDMLHRTPVLHADIPIFGLARSRHALSPSLDEHGPAVRERGWAALEDELE